MDFTTTGDSLGGLLGGIGTTITQVGQSIQAVNNIFHPAQAPAPAPAPISVAPGVLPGSSSGSSSTLLLVALVAFLALR